MDPLHSNSRPSAEHSTTLQDPLEVEESTQIQDRPALEQSTRLQEPAENFVEVDYLNVYNIWRKIVLVHPNNVNGFPPYLNLIRP